MCCHFLDRAASWQEQYVADLRKLEALQYVVFFILGLTGGLKGTIANASTDFAQMNCFFIRLQVQTCDVPDAASSISALSQLHE